MSEPAAVQPVAPRVRRRVLLASGIAAGLVTLAGCGIRLQDNAPDVPLLPRRTPVPEEQALLDLLANTRTLTSVTAEWRTGQGAVLGVALTAIHRTQSDVLAAILRAAQVPEGLVSPTVTTTTGPPASSSTSATGPATPSPPPTPTPTPTAVAPVTASQVSALERTPLEDAALLAGSAGVMRPTVAATLAQRYAATVLTGGRIPTVASGPARSRWAATTANAVIEATRSASYGFQVVTAQSQGAQRALGAAALTELAALERAQSARLTTTPDAVLGYDLPYAVTTPALARRLALDVLTALRSAYGSQLPSLTTAPAQPFLDLFAWLGRVEVLLRRWGGTLAPFPGMTG